MGAHDALLAYSIFLSFILKKKKKVLTTVYWRKLGFLLHYKTSSWMYIFWNPIQEI